MHTTIEIHIAFDFEIYVHFLYFSGPTKVSEARKKSPQSIRALYGDLSNDMKNACHGSDSPPNAEREIEIIFPHILHDEDEVAGNRPGTAESAMVNGHSVPIRGTKSILEGTNSKIFALGLKFAMQLQMKKSTAKAKQMLPREQK